MDLLSYLTNINDFFKYRALHYSVVNQLFVENDNYDFEYIEYETPEEVIPEPEPEGELVEVDDEGFFEDWDEGESEADWGTDWGEDESFEEPIEEETEELEEEDDLTHLLQPSVLPQVYGAVIKFYQSDLIILKPPSRFLKRENEI